MTAPRMRRSPSAFETDQRVIPPEGIGLRGPDRCWDDADALGAEHLVERSRELRVAVRTRNLTSPRRPSIARFLAC